MTPNWLAQTENQLVLQNMGEAILDSLAPHEIAVFREVFPSYIELAQQGEVKTVKESARAFSMSAPEHFLLIIVIHTLIALSSQLLWQQRKSKLHDLKDLDPADLRPLVEQILRDERQVYRLRQQLNPEITAAFTVHLTDIYTPYERGYQSLLCQLGQNHLHTLTLGERLQLNLAATRRYGDTSERQAERSEIIERFNELTIKELGTSFTKLCQEKRQGM